MKIIRATEEDVEAIVSINGQFRNAFERIGQTMPISKYYSRGWVLEEIEAGNQFVLKNDSGLLGA